MSVQPPKILITRPTEQAESFANILKKYGYHPVIFPLFKIVEHPAPLPSLPDLNKFDTLCFTSVHGVHALSDQESLKSFPVYVTGKQTAKTARALGFETVKYVAKSAREMFQKIEEDKVGSLLYPRGQDISCAPERILKKTQIESLIVYDMREVAVDKGAVKDLFLNGDLSTVLVFSSRSGRVLVDVLRQYGLENALGQIKALCLSEEVLKSISGLDWQESRACHTPDRDHMLAILNDMHPLR